MAYAIRRRRRSAMTETALTGAAAAAAGPSTGSVLTTTSFSRTKASRLCQRRWNQTAIFHSSKFNMSLARPGRGMSLSALASMIVTENVDLEWNSLARKVDHVKRWNMDGWPTRLLMLQSEKMICFKFENGSRLAKVTWWQDPGNWAMTKTTDLVEVEIGKWSKFVVSGQATQAGIYMCLLVPVPSTVSFPFTTPRVVTSHAPPCCTSSTSGYPRCRFTFALRFSWLGTRTVLKFDLHVEVGGSEERILWQLKRTTKSLVHQWCWRTQNLPQKPCIMQTEAPFRLVAILWFYMKRFATATASDLAEITCLRGVSTLWFPLPTSRCSPAAAGHW